MTRRAAFPGFIPLGGKSRRYQLEGSTETISRRQYERLRSSISPLGNYQPPESQYQRDTRRAQAAGYKNYSEYRRIRKSNAAKWDKHRDQMLRAGVPESKLGPFSRYQHLWYQVDEERNRLPKNSLGQSNDHDSEMLRDPEGPLAQLLVAMGYRDAESTTPPGDSPLKHK